MQSSSNSVVRASYWSRKLTSPSTLRMRESPCHLARVLLLQSTIEARCPSRREIPVRSLDASKVCKVWSVRGSVICELSGLCRTWEEVQPGELRIRRFSPHHAWAREIREPVWTVALVAEDHGSGRQVMSGDWWSSSLNQEDVKLGRFCWSNLRHGYSAGDIRFAEKILERRSSRSGCRDHRSW